VTAGERHEDRGVRWMLAFQAGDDAAFEELVREYSQFVFALLRRLLGPAEEIEDLAQESFVRLYRARERYRPVGRLSTFLYRITYNLALNRIRDRGRQGAASLSSSRDGAPLEVLDPREAARSPSDATIWSDRVHRGLQQLPENQRAALVLQHFDGFDLQQIGDVLGCSDKAVKSLLHRARENLRQILTPMMDAEDGL